MSPIEEGWPPDDMPPPAGFQLSPSDAYRTVAANDRLSVKHHWACYRDDRYYYIYDTYVTPRSAKNAFRHGVKVNGVTGDLER